ncbi:uncharacterized protein LOC106669492 [Cimex lectularius]|uniref:Uncharacterized protein n=1 Tax=Cimex lectularius TaxID=79782 RepID=A0A8I6TG75_CIMLE|nr:uncharacterized protein LOC106669492 [Cimex lectularius]XP_014254500.1 uncharacterized protein LOC106669492 [Cimex lectularius]
MEYVLLVSLFVACCVGHSLPVSQTADEEAQTKSEKTVTKRSIPWYLPTIYLPPIIQVHHVIYLQKPDGRCFSDLPRPTPGPSGNTTNALPSLEDRLGVNTNDTNQEPSKCVWAIVACCSPNSREIRYSCFELLGCEGPFWDENPCESRIVTAAANTALKFYMSNSRETQNNDI